MTNFLAFLDAFTNQLVYIVESDFCFSLIVFGCFTGIVVIIKRFFRGF